MCQIDQFQEIKKKKKNEKQIIGLCSSFVKGKRTIMLKYCSSIGKIACNFPWLHDCTFPLEFSFCTHVSVCTTNKNTTIFRDYLHVNSRKTHLVQCALVCVCAPHCHIVKIIQLKVASLSHLNGVVSFRGWSAINK